MDNGTPAEDRPLDVLVVGAGLSGIAVGRYLAVEHPAKSYLIMEQRAASGGTWDLFRYPGVRSDSDLHTFSYAFKPWQDKESIASGARILDYLREASRENGVDEHIVYRRRVISADWSSAQTCWTVEIEDVDTGERTHCTARWLFCASGYYSYDHGHAPDLPGQERFGGRIVHPQQWPADLDCTGQQVVVIGSGATAITLVPALATSAAHVTMLQRTPTYVLPVPTSTPSARRYRRWLGDRRGSAAARAVSRTSQWLFWLFCRRFPAAARRMIRRVTTEQLPPGYPVDEHFNPPYDPWDQRMCIAPDGDLFSAIRDGSASVVTDRVATLTDHGVLLESSRELPADVVVTATGLVLLPLGGIAVTVDGVPVSAHESVLYRGVLMSGMPNLAVALGYPNASWTLKIDLVCEYWCRLLTYLDDHGYAAVCPVADPDLATHPALYLSAGYVRRSLDALPLHGDEPPWQASLSYHADVKLLRRAPVVDEHLRLSRLLSAPPRPDAPGR